MMKESGKEEGGRRIAGFQIQVKGTLSNITKRLARSLVACVPPTSNSQRDHPTPERNAQCCLLPAFSSLGLGLLWNTHRKNQFLSFYWKLKFLLGQRCQTLSKTIFPLSLISIISAVLNFIICYQAKTMKKENERCVFIRNNTALKSFPERLSKG